VGHSQSLGKHRLYSNSDNLTHHMLHVRYSLGDADADDNHLKTAPVTSSLA